MGHFGLDAHISQNLRTEALTLHLHIGTFLYDFFFYWESEREAQRAMRCDAARGNGNPLCARAVGQRGMRDARYFTPHSRRADLCPYKGEGKANTRFKP